MPLDEAFRKSMELAHLGPITLDQVMIWWLVTENFRNGKPMDISDSTKNEVRYQQRGYGRYVEIMELFGWNVLPDFYRQEHLNYMKKAPSDELHPVDSRILRLSIAANADLTPIIHAWGVHPVDPDALKKAISKKRLLPSKDILKRLQHYQSIIPADNAAFQDYYRAIYPTQPEGGHPDYGFGWFNLWKSRYNENHADHAKQAMQNIIDLYFSTQNHYGLKTHRLEKD